MRGLGRTGGFVLVEAMIALLILGVCLVSLAAGLDNLSNALHRAEDRWTGSPETAERRGTGWDWGPRVVRAAWLADGSLSVAVLAGADAEQVVVGIWVDGWLLRQMPVSAEGSARVPATAFATAVAHTEVCVRVRTEVSGWGVPWRLAMPDAAVSGVGVVPGLQSTGSLLTIHLPAAFTAGVDLITSEGSCEVSLGAPFPLDIPLGGVTMALGEAARQDIVPWYSGEKREIDVYF